MERERVPFFMTGTRYGTSSQNKWNEMCFRSSFLFAHVFGKKSNVELKKIKIFREKFSFHVTLSLTCCPQKLYTILSKFVCIKEQNLVISFWDLFVEERKRNEERNGTRSKNF